MMLQTTRNILMIQPSHFGYNPETAENNYYQVELEGVSAEEVNTRANQEFIELVAKLRSEYINVEVFQDSHEAKTPDSIFPNNWVSFHEDGRVALYPMYAPIRRQERRPNLIDELSEKYQVRAVVDFSSREEQNKFLEGTGSMVLDRVNSIVYAALSERTHLPVLNEFCKEFGYSKVTFTSSQSVNGKRLSIYHTNVMMCLGEQFCVICLDSIDKKSERQSVVNSLEKTEKEIIDITEDQVVRFAGNMLQVGSADEKTHTVMSTSAFESLSDTQREAIKKYGAIVHSPLDTIEAAGGGSARCMIAEIFNPLKTDG